MLACNYHTYIDYNKKQWVGGEAFNIPLSNTEDVIYDMLKDINEVQLRDLGYTAVFDEHENNGQLRQHYVIFVTENGFSREDYLNEGENVGFGFIKLKD